MNTEKRMEIWSNHFRKLVPAAFAALLCIGVAVPASAQNPATASASGDDVLMLNLDRALEIALSTNPTIKVAEMEIERWDYVRKEAMGNHLPSLSVGGQFAYNIVKQEMAKGMSFGSDMAVSGSADLSIPLFAPAIYSTMKMSRMQQELAVEQARSSRIELVKAVKDTYYLVLLCENTYDVLKASDETVREYVDNTRAMYDAGLASEYDLLSAEVQLSNLQPNIIAASNGIETAKQLLKMYLSIPENVEIEVADSLDGHRDESFEVVPMVNVDLSDNTAVRQLDYAQMLNRQQIRLANTGYMPTIAAFGSVMLSGQDKSTSFGSGGSGPKLNETDPTPMTLGMFNSFLNNQSSGVSSTDKWWWQTPVSAGIRVSIPIFTGLKEHYKVKQLKNSIAQMDLQREYLIESQQVAVRNAANSMVSARETVIANEHTMQQAEKAYNISRTRFEAGAGTMLEMNQAQTNVMQAHLNRSTAIHDFLVAKSEYDRVIGKEE